MNAGANIGACCPFDSPASDRINRSLTNASVSLSARKPGPYDQIGSTSGLSCRVIEAALDRFHTQSSTNAAAGSTHSKGGTAGPMGMSEGPA